MQMIKFNPIKIILFLILTLIFSACTRQHQTGDLRIIKERIVALNTGNGIPSSGEYKKAAIRELEASAQLILEQGSHIPALDISQPGVESKVSATYGRILVLAKAYNTPGQKYYHSDSLLAEINNSLLHGLKWSKPGSQFPGNWYYWQIDAPRNLGPALVLMQDFLEEDMMKDQIAGLQNLITDLPYLTGANGVMQGGGRINYAVLTNDEDKMRNAMHLIDIEMAITNTKTGILEDYSYQFHDQHIYTGTYGAHYVLNTATAIFLTRGTKFEPSKERVEIFNKHLTEHVQWTIIGDKFDLSVMGRNLRGSPRVSLTTCLLMSQYPSDYQERMKIITARLLSFNKGSLSINDAPFADNFQNPANTPLNGFRYFYKADYGVARRPDFFVSVKMFSDRTMDYEYLTGLNVNGRNLSSGMTYISRTGNELWSHINNLETVYDWEHLPGTTARLGVRPSNFSNFSESKFAGGAGSRDNGIISFQLIPVINDFHARKSYFMFPSGFVALGSDITSKKKGEPVSTTVTQWGLSSSNQPLILSNGNKMSTITSAELKSLDWAYCDSVGYLFHSCPNINLKKDSLYATIYLNHGSNPQKDKYAYTVLPACSQQQVIDYSGSPEVQILENSEKIHALRDVKNNATGIIFWEPGRFDNITVNHPAIVYYEEKTEVLRFRCAILCIIRILSN